ncbi:hypothetical protein [Parageobacillus thermoglucosidasius]|uniref:hypothetical protein n=1 Tax=Parageobacillus thermoglucosidasius TaxID=1426 RepID=UPI0027EB4743|nr:hypothetical protein PthstB1num2_00210 [Parageobacillus thermoglucosidasius]
MKHVRRIGFYTKKVAQFRSLPEHRKALRQQRLLAYKRAMHERFEAEPVVW